MSLLLLNGTLEVLATAIRQMKEIGLGKEEVKVYIYRWCDSIQKRFKAPARKPLYLVNTFSKSAGYKSTAQNQ